MRNMSKRIKGHRVLRRLALTPTECGVAVLIVASGTFAIRASAAPTSPTVSSFVVNGGGFNGSGGLVQPVSVTIHGSGFGSPPAGYTPPGSSDPGTAGEDFGNALFFGDDTQSWTLGGGSDPVGWITDSYTNSVITMSFGGLYGAEIVPQFVQQGDTVEVDVLGASCSGRLEDYVGQLIACTTPTAPTSVTGVAGNAQGTVHFTPPDNDGGSTITSYAVTAADITDTANGGQTASGSGSPITVTGLTNGDTYTFTVTATNGAGTGPPSTPSNPVVPAILVITTESLPAGTVSTKTNKIVYSATLSASGGNPPYKWALTSGSFLPPGLILNTDGMITGKAKTAGNWQFTVKVTDMTTAAGTKNKARATLSITIT